MKIDTNDTTGKITFTFDDGLPDAMFDVNKTHFDLCIHAMMKQFENRIKDTAAIPRKQPDGSTLNVTEAMRRAKVVEMIDHLESGTDEWNLKSSGTRAPKQDPSILALAAALGISYEDTMKKMQQIALDEIAKL